MNTPQATSAAIQARQQLFRALHQADPSTRQALMLLARGKSLAEVGQQLGIHPAFIRRRLAALSSKLAG